MANEPTNKKYERCIFFVEACNSSVFYPELDMDLVHYTVNYLRSLDVPMYQTFLLTDNPKVYAWGCKAGGLHPLMLPGKKDRMTESAESVDSIRAEFPDHDVIILADWLPVREKDLLDLMIAQVRTEKDVLFETATMRLSQFPNARAEFLPCHTCSVAGFRHDSEATLQLLTHCKDYPVFHNAECGQWAIMAPYQFNAKVMDVAIREGFDMSAWTAPCPAEYPHRVEIKVDKQSSDN